MPQTVDNLSTPHIADACMRIGVPVRCAPSELRPLSGNMRCVGRAMPVRHVGSVDVFLEAIDRAPPGDVLVVDNNGRRDEGCIGDLITLEAEISGISGIIIWGMHRDTNELLEIDLPFFSLGAIPVGPQRFDPRSPDTFAWARIGQWIVSPDDIIVADTDGVLICPASRMSEIVATAEVIHTTEQHHAEKMRTGNPFRVQLHFDEFLKKRKTNPRASFRRHLREFGGSIEE